MLPGLTPATDLGAVGVAAYAKRQGVDIATFLESPGPTLIPEQVDKNFVDLVVNPSYDQGAYQPTPTGLTSAIRSAVLPAPDQEWLNTNRSWPPCCCSSRWMARKAMRL
jgi:hypothetical protein